MFKVFFKLPLALSWLAIPKKSWNWFGKAKIRRGIGIVSMYLIYCKQASSLLEKCVTAELENGKDKLCCH